MLPWEEKMLIRKENCKSALIGVLGKTIASLAIAPTVEYDEVLMVRFTDGSGIQMRDDGQFCCEHRYMHCDDNLADFVGTQLLGANLADAPNVPDKYGEHEVQFLIVSTSIGEFTVETHNEHTGCYGGFDIVVEPLENQE